MKSQNIMKMIEGVISTTDQSKIIECKSKNLKLPLGAVASTPSLIYCKSEKKDHNSMILWLFK